MRQYRIKELDGEFIIEGSYEKTMKKGYFWNRTFEKVEYWRRLDIHHEPIGAIKYGGEPIKPPLRPFETLELAKRYFDTHIDKEAVKSEPVYHTLGKPSGGSSYMSLG